MISTNKSPFSILKNQPRFTIYSLNIGGVSKWLPVDYETQSMQSKPITPKETKQELIQDLNSSLVLALKLVDPVVAQSQVDEYDRYLKLNADSIPNTFNQKYYQKYLDASVEENVDVANSNLAVFTSFVEFGKKTVFKRNGKKFDAYQEYVMTGVYVLN